VVGQELRPGDEAGHRAIGSPGRDLRVLGLDEAERQGGAKALLPLAQGGRRGAPAGGQVDQDHLKEKGRFLPQDLLAEEEIRQLVEAATTCATGPSS